MEDRHHHVGKNFMSKNARIIYAWRLPIMHAVVLFCLVQQMKSIDRGHIEENPPGYVKAIRDFKSAKNAYWERMCDLRKRD